MTLIRGLTSALASDPIGPADRARGRKSGPMRELLSRSVESLPTIDHVTLDIQPLTPKRIPDLATLFDQGGDPKWC